MKKKKAKKMKTTPKTTATKKGTRIIVKHGGRPLSPRGSQLGIAANVRLSKQEHGVLARAAHFQSRKDGAAVSIQEIMRQAGIAEARRILAGKRATARG